MIQKLKGWVLRLIEGLDGYRRELVDDTYIDRRIPILEGKAQHE